MKRICMLCALALSACGGSKGGSPAPGPAPAAACAFAGVPASVTAGDTVAAQLTITDAQHVVVAGYRGTVHVTSTDAAAQLPGDQSFSAADSGTHPVAVRLVTAGNQTFTATDAANPAITCTSAAVAVQPGAPHLVITLPADVNAGIVTTASLAAQDGFGNPVASYAGTVNLVSSDAGATMAATARVAEGHALFPVTFATMGAQTLSAADGANASIAGSANVRVHGFVYSDPVQSSPAVKLVVNALASNAHLVQLDLVAARPLPKGFAVGMNLPVDSSRVSLFPVPFVEGNLFDPGAPPKAEVVRLAGGVLYSGLSQKAGGAGGGKTDVPVAAGGTYYSVRLALPATATPGTVFDGSLPMRGFRAAVRDLLGNDAVSQRDFAIGKLEVR
ncbi:MAG TPA: hypothetical protein VI356_09030 [Myxococcales bacterium]